MKPVQIGPAFYLKNDNAFHIKRRIIVVDHQWDKDKLEKLVKAEEVQIKKIVNTQHKKIKLKKKNSNFIGIG